MKKTALRISLLAIALSVFSSINSFAQFPSYNDMDVLFGFRATSGTGTAFCGVIDLGPVVNLNHNITFSLGNIGSYMATNWGSDWFTRIDPTTLGTSIQWGVVATDNVTNFTNDLWSTRNPAVRPQPWPRSFNQSVGSTDIGSAGNTYTGYAIAPGTNNAVVEGAQDANSWAFFQPGGAGGQGISFGTWNPSNEGNTNTMLAFDSIPTATAQGQLGTQIGFFSWASDGTISFTVIPEPSTYRMMALGALGLLGVMILRRRRSARA
jgi:hypothetical protein